MAWYYGTYACGHEGRTNIIGPTKNRQWIADKRFEGLCPECEEKRREEERDKATEAARKAAEENEYPELTGTEKQVNWALTIREGIIRRASDDIENDECRSYPYNTYGVKMKRSEKAAYTAELIQWLLQKTSAKFWIDHRRDTFVYYYTEMYEADKAKKAEIAIEKEVAEMVIIEPEQKTHAGVAEVMIRNDKVCVYYQKDDDFRKIVKSNRYEFDWDNSCWFRKITKWSGPIEDRAAEIGNILLNEGFTIEIANEMKECAIEGTFKEERRNWIWQAQENQEDQYEGWFMIYWPGKDDTLYSKARKLPGAKWSRERNCIVVPDKSFKEVEDFAGIESFSISEGAKELIEAGYAATVKVNPQKPVKEEKVDKLQRQLESDFEIPEDLRDDE